MIVVSIEPVSRDRSRIRLDSGNKFILYKGEIRILKIKPESELSDETYNQIMKAVLPKRAKLRAMNLLKARDYTEHQLRRKLSDAEYPNDIIDIAMDYVKSFGYINDKNYAVSFIKEQAERRSRKEIYQKLQNKGINRDVIEGAFHEVIGESSGYEDRDTFNECEVILKTLRKKGYTGLETYEDKQKLLAYFYRKGFEVDSVYRAMDIVRSETEDNM